MRSKTVFSDSIITYVENSMESTKKATEIIHEFSEAWGYKINIKNELYF